MHFSLISIDQVQEVLIQQLEEAPSSFSPPEVLQITKQYRLFIAIL